MISMEEFELANDLYTKRERLRSILDDFDSEYVKTVVGLVSVNAASKHKVQGCDDADWLHQSFPRIENTLNDLARRLIKMELDDIQKLLANLVKE